MTHRAKTKHDGKNELKRKLPHWNEMSDDFSVEMGPQVNGDDAPHI